MKYQLLIVGFVASTISISIFGFYALNINQEFINSSKKGEQHFKDITTAAAEVSSYAKRAEGHLFLYLGLHRKADKDKFPKRVKSLHENISILDQEIKNPEARKILDKIKAIVVGILPAGNTLIAYHDKDMEAIGKFELEHHQEAIFELHEKLSAIRKLGVELVTLEIQLEDNLKSEISKNATRLQYHAVVTIVAVSIFTLFLGYILIKMIKTLNKEISSRLQSEEALKLEKNKLKDALDKLKTLSGIVPICMYCKQIRDDKGYWNQLEDFISKHSKAEFSHSICEKCLEKHHSDCKK